MVATIPADESAQDEFVILSNTPDRRCMATEAAVTSTHHLKAF